MNAGRTEAEPQAAQAARLEAWIAARLQQALAVELTDFSGASSGLSNETQLFTLRYRDPEPRTERLVLRSSPAKAKNLFPDYDLGIQGGVMQALAPTGLPVPRVRWQEDDSAVIGAPFLIMDHIAGVVPTDSPPGFHGQGLYFDATPERRAALWAATVEHMARLHALDWTGLSLPRLPGMGDTQAQSIASQISLLERWYDWGKISGLPAIDAGLRWLKDHPARFTRLALLWGDARPGNIIHQDDAVAAMLDWELATVGPAEFDVFYLIWSSELLANVNGLQTLPGLPDREATLKLYERMSGRPLEDIQFAEIFCLVRLSIMAVLGVRAAVQDIYTNDYIRENAALKALERILS